MGYQSYEKMDLQGSVLRIEKSSIYDGDGLRTVVFLKGCPLRCRWCSTPESHQKGIQTTLDGSITYGAVMTVEEVMAEVRKDIPFYFHSGGGMTVSGGEILAQPEFTYYLVSRACWEGIDTCIETSLYGEWSMIEPILKNTNTAFVDLKLMDPKAHMKYTGVPNDIILHNIRKAGAEKSGMKLIIRRPLIPGVNDSQTDLEQLGQFLMELPGVDCLQLLPYHRLGTDTYRKLGLTYQLPDVKTPSKEYMEWCMSITNKYIKTII
ncbi:MULTISPECIES: radical SAM protein [unclassified Lactonifactor]|uniref:radical SAM protein n=1 Tax=unclassified Lactonifactor TaxID=2636670 RepID=UPI0018FEF6D9|nr:MULTISPECIES: radical SAM protein [unclassified Lactonifactor]